MVVDCTGFIQGLDLECLLVNTFSGTLEIFTFVSLITIAGLAAFFKMPNYITLVMIALFSIMLFPITSFLYTITIFFSGLFIYFTLTKVFK